jgi:hypothetical protein
MDKALSESRRIETRIAELRGELILKLSSPEIMEVLHSQPTGTRLKNGEEATAEEALREEMSFETISLEDTHQPRELYRQALAELGIDEQRVELKVFGVSSPAKKLAQLRATKTLRSLREVEGIGYTLKIDGHGYVSMR